MLFCCASLIGAISLSQLPVSLFPEITFPRLTVLTGYANASPSEVENLITRPLEQTLAGVSGVTRIQSVSQEGLALIRVDLRWGESLDRAMIGLRQKLDVARPVLPQETADSVLLRYDPTDEPLLVLRAVPRNMAFAKAREFLEVNLRPQLERLPGIAAVSIRGGYRREIQVEMNTQTLHSLGLTLREVADILSSAAYSFPAGQVRSGTRELTVRYEGDFRSTADIGNVIVRAGRSGRPLRLSEIANIRDATKEREGSAMVDGEPAIVVSLRKEQGRNSVATASAVLSELEGLNRRFSKTIKLQVLHDSSNLVSNSIAAVRNAAMLGMLVAFAVLLLFLRRVWTATIVLVSIPTAILFTFACMYALDISINVMSLGGLSLGIGMLVDNAIVVTEAIALERESLSARDKSQWLHRTAIRGARQVSGSVVAATLTSVVVFLPIIFVSGIAGAVFRELALTVTASLAASLLTSLTLVPMLAAHEPSAESWFGRTAFRLETFLQPVFMQTERAVATSKSMLLSSAAYGLRKPKPILFGAGGLVMVSLITLALLPRELFSKVDRGVVQAELKLPAGASIAESEESLRALHAVLSDKTRSVVSLIGHEPTDLSSLAGGVRRANQSSTTFYLTNPDSSDFVNQLKTALAKSSVKSDVRLIGDPMQQLLDSAGQHLTLEISVDRTAHHGSQRADAPTDRNKQIHARALALIRQHLSGRARISGSIEEQRPEVRYMPRREHIAVAGLSQSDVAGGLRASVSGLGAGQLRQNDQIYPVRLQIPKEQRNSAALLQTGLRVEEDRLIQIDNLLQRADVQGRVRLLRRDQQNYETIRFNFLAQNAARPSGADLAEELRGLLAQERLPVSVKTAGNAAETNRSLMQLSFAFAFSALLIYQLLAGQFESFLQPFSLSAPVGLMLTGAAVALVCSAGSINISSVIGLILSAGIVVNAAIVLFERIQQERRTNANTPLDRVVLSAVAARIRPILLTTLTTLVGMLPLALAQGGRTLQGPMAITVIGALLFGTVLSVAVFPALYVFIERLRPQHAPSRGAAL